MITQNDSETLGADLPATNYTWFLDGIRLDQHTQTISVYQAGNYSVQVQKFDGCWSEVSAVFAYALPCHVTNTESFAGNNQYLCEKDTAQFQALSPRYGKGSWKRISGWGNIHDRENPASPVTGLGYGENVFEWSVSANSCGTDSLRAWVTLTRLAKPATPVITQKGVDSLMCSHAGEGYEWYLNGNLLHFGQKQVIRVNQVGFYSVRVKEPLTCFSDLSPAFEYGLNTTSPVRIYNFNLYPNPTTGKVAIVLPTSLGSNIHISVYDALGRIVIAEYINLASENNKVELDFSAQKVGIFIIKLQSKNGIITKRLFKTGAK